MCHSKSCSLVDPSTKNQRVMTSKTITMINAIDSHEATRPIQTITDSAISSIRRSVLMVNFYLKVEKLYENRKKM